MGKNIIACRWRSYAPFEALAFKHLAGLGVRHVEIKLPDQDEVDGVKAELERYGLTASTLHGDCDIRRADIAERIERQMPILAALGTRLLFVSVRADETPLETAYARLRAAGEVAAAGGVTIVMETHPDLASNVEVTLATMEAVDHPNVRVNYDTANVYFYNHNVDSVEQLRPIVPYVAAVHLKDTGGGYREWNFPALGRGVVDFAGVFKVLDEAGFDGPCTLELEGVEGEIKTERLVCDRVAESLGYLRGLGRF